MRADFLKLSIVTAILADQCQRLGCIQGFELIEGKCVEVDLGYHIQWVLQIRQFRLI